MSVTADIMKEQVADATDDAELIEGAELRCAGCGRPMKDNYRFPVFGEDGLDLDYLRMPQSPFDHQLPRRWAKLSDNVFHSPPCLFTHGFEVAGAIPAADYDRAVSQYLTERHRLHDQVPVQRKPPAEHSLLYFTAPAAAAAGGAAAGGDKKDAPLLAGITMAQGSKLEQLYPFLQMKLRRYPDLVPPLPGEAESFTLNDLDFLRWSRVEEISEYVHRQRQNAGFVPAANENKGDSHPEPEKKADPRPNADPDKFSDPSAIEKLLHEKRQRQPELFFHDDVGKAPLDDDPDSDPEELNPFQDIFST